MNKFRRMGRLIAASTTTAVALSVVPFASAQNGGIVEFSVSNITDFHGYLESDIADPETGEFADDVYAGDVMGAAYLAALVEYVNQDQEYIVTTSGDNVGGSAFVSAISDDQYTLEFLNELGVDVSATGNHEFDRGIDDLLGRITDSSEYPILGANVYRDGERALESHHIVTTGSGVNVAFIGTVTQNTAAKVSPAGIEGVEFHDPVAETNTVAQELKDSGQADVVIALMHEDARAFASGFSTDVDALLGGDTHQPYSGQIERGDNLPLYYAQSHEYGKLLTDLDITYDTRAGELVDITVNQYDATDVVEFNLEPDGEVAATVAEATAQADELGALPVAEIEHPFTRGSNPGGEPGSNRGVESTLNNLLAEASRSSMEESAGRPIDLGFMNAGGVRADLPAGEVTYADAFAVQPFGNSVAYGTLTGADILQALEDQWKGPEEGRPRLSLGVSDNFSYAYDPEAGQGERVIQATIDGEPLDPEAEYTVAMSTFLFEGGDGFTSFANVGNLVDVGYMDVQVFIDYLEANPTVAPRAAQSDVGVSVDGDVTAGENITVNLSSLNYSSEGEPRATTVTVELGSATETAEIDDTTTEADAGFGEVGRATVELTVPEDYAGEPLIITTDAGTEVVAPVELPDDNGTSGADRGSSAPAGSSADGFVGLLLGALAGLAGALGVVQFFLPNAVEDIQAQINNLIGR